MQKKGKGIPMAGYHEHFEEKMKSFPFNLLLNILLAISICLTAELGRLAGIKGPALPVSVIWPATGFSLAALLLFGFRVWPGIFFGNLVYNTLSLLLITKTMPPSILIALLTASLVSFGSLLQALVGNIIMRSFSTPQYFKTVTDVMIFLFPAGLFTCFIASTIGTTALFSFYGRMSVDELLIAWLTFWVGDTMGVFVVTPFLVVWALHRDKSFFLVSYFWEFLAILVTFSLLTFLVFIESLNLIPFYIPMCMWSAYRFRMHGATLSIVLITLILVVPGAFDAGPLSQQEYPHRLRVFITYIEVLVGMNLILAAVVDERDTLLSQTEPAKREREISNLDEEIIKEKLLALGPLASGISRQIHVLFGRMSQFLLQMKESFKTMKSLYPTIQERVGSKLAIEFFDQLESTEKHLTKILDLQKKIKAICELMVNNAQLSVPRVGKIRTFDINQLLKNCSTKLMSKVDPNFKLKVIENYDDSIEKIKGWPEDLTHAFMHLLDHSIELLKQKKDLMGVDFEPQIRINSKNEYEKIIIEIEDNGVGLQQNEIKNFLTSFDDFHFRLDEPTVAFEKRKLSILIAHDIILHIYQGEIKVNSIPNQFLKLTVSLPKDIFV